MALRVGCGRSPAIIDYMNCAPFNVTTPGSAAATAALDDRTHVERRSR
jgi:histidinol-phosphate/aromatic aminotransferase/cobyric acid decarboxylase-like protein